MELHVLNVEKQDDAHIQTVLLDLGGPVLNEDREYAAWDDHLLKLLAEDGVTVARNAYSSALTEATRACHPQPRVSALWSLMQPDIPRFRRLKDAFRKYTSRPERHLSTSSVRPGAHEAVRALAERHTLALAANQPAGVREILRREEILAPFSWQYVSEDLGVAKPDLLFFQIILDKLGVPAESAVMVGDRVDADVLPAKALGLHTVRVLQGPYAQQVPCTSLHQPDLTVESIADVPRAVASLAR
ncbi:MAG: HAD family hydrolase [Candidatus Bipolaricaulota bacterium]